MPDYLDKLVAHWERQGIGPATKLVAHWERQGIGPATTRPTIAELEAWERHYGVKLPSDLREYFLRINGVRNGEDLDFGNDLMTFLPLKSVVPESERSKTGDKSAPKRFVIADYSISCYWWCAWLTTEAQATTRIFLGTNAVADSLEEFIALYVADSAKVHTFGISGSGA